jgi:hypothetical protein
MAKKSVKEQIETDNPDFVAEVVGLSVDELNARVAKLAADTEEVQQSLEKASEEGGPIYDARAVLKELTGPYNDSKKALRLKTRYLVQLIEEKGGA